MAEDEVSQADQFRAILLDAQEMHDPVWEAALGVKNRLLKDGWPEETAIALAHEWTITLLLVLRKGQLED